MEHLKIKTVYIIQSYWKIALFSLLVFCFYSASLVLKAAAIDMHYFEFVLVVFNSEHFLMFCLLPVYFIILYSTFSKQMLHIIVRHRSFLHFFLYDIMPIVLVTLLYVLLHIVCAALIGLFGQMVFDIEFSPACGQDAMLTLFTHYFSTSVGALLSSILYTCIGLCFFAVLIKSSYYYWGKKTVVLSTLLLYFLSIFALQKSADEYFPYVFLSNYFILPMALIKEHVWLFPVITILMVVLILVVIRKKWRYRDL